MMRVFGYKKADFTTDQGVEITGYNIYIGTDINPKYGEGFSVERAYLTDAKIAKDNIDLAALVNTDVHVYYNRYGKVDSIQPC